MFIIVLKVQFVGIIFIQIKSLLQTATKATHLDAMAQYR